ncbi:hypothetical protein [Algivirga pacifica]|uniref:Uncharacterized protein n=1 Tax=Algivirga pacifica TaxID=1162670 RepID=A0ABP9DAW3_9BACT
MYKVKHVANQLLLFIAILSIGLASSSCGKKKKLAEEQLRNETVLVEKSKSQLKELLAKENKTLEEVEEDRKALDQIKGGLMNIENVQLKDEELKSLIAKEEAKLDQEAVEIEKRMAELAQIEAEKARRAAIREQMESKENKDIYYYMDRIPTAADTPSANKMITETLSLFSSPEATVLIEVYNDGSVVDYDEPTTIIRYLNLLKDTEKSPYKVKSFKKDEAGKITKLIVTKVQY